MNSYIWKLTYAYEQAFNKRPTTPDNMRLRLAAEVSKAQDTLLAIYSRQMPEFYWRLDIEMHRKDDELADQLFTIRTSFHRRSYYWRGYMYIIEPDVTKVAIHGGKQDRLIELQRYANTIKTSQGDWLTDPYVMTYWVREASRSVPELGAFVTLEDQILWHLKDSPLPEDVLVSDIKGYSYNDPFDYPAYGDATYHLIRTSAIEKIGIDEHNTGLRPLRIVFKRFCVFIYLLL